MVLWGYYNIIKKKVPSNIKELLNPRARAYWYMDNGSAGITDENGNRAHRIYTNSFTYSDIEFLSKVLNALYDWDCSIHSDSRKKKPEYYIYISAQNSKEFSLKPF